MFCLVPSTEELQSIVLSNPLDCNTDLLSTSLDSPSLKSIVVDCFFFEVVLLIRGLTDTCLRRGLIALGTEQCSGTSYWLETGAVEAIFILWTPPSRAKRGWAGCILFFSTFRLMTVYYRGAV